MKQIIMTLLALMTTVVMTAQTELWIAGSAVPGGAQRLDAFPSGQFKFAGALNAGELKIMTTEKATSATRYLAPQAEDACVVNKGLAFEQTDDAAAEGWRVPFAGDRYKLVIDTKAAILHGEIFAPWRELFLAGGACEAGWKAFMLLPFTQDKANPDVFTWTGELREGKDVVEPRRIKITGQNYWGPKSLHPYTQDEAALGSAFMRHEGDDTKWEIGADGIYRLTVNVFKDTFKAEYLGSGIQP